MNVFLILLVLFVLCVFMVGYNFGPTFIDHVAFEPKFIDRDELLHNMIEILNSSIAHHFDVVVGGHGVGKSTTFALASKILSKTRCVRYLKDLPSHNQLHRYFYDIPTWITWTSLREIIAAFVPSSEEHFEKIVYGKKFPSNFATFWNSIYYYIDSYMPPPIKLDFSIDPIQMGVDPPILIIDNVKNSPDLYSLFEKAKHYADYGTMKIVFICSSSIVARTITQFSAMTRGNVFAYVFDIFYVDYYVPTRL